MKFTVASVPFLNARPLVWALERFPDRFEVDVGYDLPSRLPSLLDNGTADAVLVSSIDALTVPGRRIAAGCSISSRSRVMSVRLFSKVPLDQVQSLALDSSSLTSNALAQIVLAQMFGVRPSCTRETPNGNEMLEQHDACVLIGDKGLAFNGTGLYQLDLGEAWLNLTGLPFVWACWVGSERLSADLVLRLEDARAIGEAALSDVAREAPQGISPQLAQRYLSEVFDYRLADDQIVALTRFGQEVLSLDLAEEVFEPVIVESSSVPYPGLGSGHLG